MKYRPPRPPRRRPRARPQLGAPARHAAAAFPPLPTSVFLLPAAAASFPLQLMQFVVRCCGWAAYVPLASHRSDAAVPVPPYRLVAVFFAAGQEDTPSEISKVAADHVRFEPKHRGDLRFSFPNEDVAHGRARHQLPRTAMTKSSCSDSAESEPHVSDRTASRCPRGGR